jgi:integrase
MKGKIDMKPNLPTRTRYEVTLRGRALPKYFLPDEIHAILGSVKGINVRRDHLIINMLWQTGARISELLQIRPRDIDSYAKGIKIITLKQKAKGPKFYERLIPVEQLLLEEFEEYLRINNLVSTDSDILFRLSRQRVSDMIIRTCRRAGIDRQRAHPHTFRHSFAINLVRNRVPAYTIQQLMGHADPASTYVYAQVLASDARPFLEGIKW